MIVDCAAYVAGERTEVASDPDSLRQWCDRAEGFVWIGLRMPSESEVDAICSALDLDEVSAPELLAPHTRPVLSLEGPTLHMVLRTARYDDSSETIALGEMTVLVGPRALISIRHGHASPLGHLRKSLEHDHDLLRKGPMGVCAAIIEQVINDYAPALDGFERDAVEVERDVFSETRSQPIRRLYKLKREVRQLLIAVDSLQDPLARLVRVRGAKLSDEVSSLLGEASDQLDRTVTRIQSLSSLLDAALTASLAQISVQQNEDMRRISAWVAMAAVPTLVAGIFGMNFEHMPELRWTLGYPLALGFMAAIAALMYRGFRNGGWF